MKQILFIHVPRTAGTSMNKWAKVNAPNYQEIVFPPKPQPDLSVKWSTTQHTSIESLFSRGVFTREWFQGCFKFAFVRNPWDRLVSLYEHLKGYRLTQQRQRESNNYLGSFCSFVEAIAEGRFVKPIGKHCVADWSQANQQVEWLKWGIDYIGRYEQLDACWRLLCGRIGVEYSILPYEKKSSRVGKSYQGYYSPGLKDIVASVYQDDIKVFGYKYD